ncbi:MAG: hypothetical protein J3R72DRAFT_150238 [Linnemannia gamsii]|nr:MAG: hypothetical protein J3R72DRAFT_150238 [Linnemannia gamsii]
MEEGEGAQKGGGSLLCWVIANLTIHLTPFTSFLLFSYPVPFHYTLVSGIPQHNFFFFTLPYTITIISTTSAFSPKATITFFFFPFFAFFFVTSTMRRMGSSDHTSTPTFIIKKKL